MTDATVLETFDGFVECVRDGTAYLSLRSVSHGDAWIAECPAEKMQAAGGSRTPAVRDASRRV